MPFDINSVQGAQGVSIGVKPIPLPEPGITGFSIGARETLDAPGVSGISITTPANARLLLSPTNFVAITEPLTIAISWPGRNPETIQYNANFVALRDFPLGTPITFQASGAVYETTAVTAYFSTNTPTDVIIPITYITKDPNGYRRRRTL